MFGKNNAICIAGKNNCAIECLNYTKEKYNNLKIFSLPNKSDDGKDKWQRSFKKFSKNKDIEIINLKKLYNIKELIFFSIEYEKIIDITNFKSKKTF